MGDWVKISESSTGMKYILPFILTVATALQGSLIVIDNIELGLHPSSLINIMNGVVDIAKNENIQFVISTHSEIVFLTLLYHVLTQNISPNDVVIYLVYKDYEGTKVYRIEPKIPLELPEEISKILKEEFGVYGEGLFQEGIYIINELIKKKVSKL